LHFLSIIAGLIRLLSGDIIAAILSLVLMPFSVVTIRAANRAPPNRSRLHAIVGWLFGFLVVNAVILACVGIISMLNTG
jgi:hypothetical protein